MSSKSETLLSVALDLVVICSFPGRFQSVLALLQTFPADFPAPVVLLQYPSLSQGEPAIPKVLIAKKAYEKPAYPPELKP